MTPALKLILLQGVGWSPASLGASLLALVDARRADKFIASGGSVSSITDIVSGNSFEQSFATAKPAYNATGINGGPSFDFDGIDDEMTYAGVWLPTGANKCRIWTLARQDSLAADATTRALFSYGGPTGGTSRQVRRGVPSGVNRANTNTDNAGVAVSVSNTTVDYSGVHVTLSDINGATAQTDVDGVAGTPATAVTTSTGTTRTRLGANSAASAGAFGKIGISQLLVDDGSAAAVSQTPFILAYLKAIGGIA